MKQRTIKSIAKTVRRLCSEFAFSHAALCHPFYRKNDLRCMCAVASSFLCQVLKLYGYKSTFHVGHYDTKSHKNSCINHCWVEVDGFIVDITVSQFNHKLPNIYIGRNFDAYLTKKIVNFSKDLRVQFRSWDVTQSPAYCQLFKIYQAKFR